MFVQFNFFCNFAQNFVRMKNGLIIFLMCMFAQALTAQNVDANTGATQPVDTPKVVSHSEDLSYALVIVNKTSSNYSLTLDGKRLGKVAPKKKQIFNVLPGGNGNLVALQLDGYSIVPSKIMWTIPKQTPGTTVTFTINKK